MKQREKSSNSGLDKGTQSFSALALQLIPASFTGIASFTIHFCGLCPHADPCRDRSSVVPLLKKLLHLPLSRKQIS